jgi:hypothetical protein
MLATLVRLIVLMLVASSASLAESQVLSRPARPFGGLFGAGAPPDPSRARHELTLMVNLLGTHGDPLEPYGTRPVAGVQATYGGFVDTGLRYQRASPMRSAVRSVEAEGRAYGTWYSMLTQPLWGGEVRARATTDLGRRSGLDASLRLRLDPFVSLGAFTPLQSEVDINDIPHANPTSGLSDSRAWASDESASFRHRLSPRNTISTGYSYTRRDLPADQGFDNTTQAANLSFDGSIGRTSGLSASYRYTWTGTFLDASDWIPLEQHSAEAGYRYSKRMSSTRTLSLALGGGATRAETVSAATRTRREDWLPSGRGGVSLDLGRTWTVGADYRRALAVLYGVTADSYFTDAASVSAGGLIGSRLDVTFFGAYATGRAVLTEASGGRYETHAFTGQVRYAMARSCAAVANYSYYKHQFRAVTDLPEAFPPRLERSTVQVGLAFWVPLHRTRAPRAGGGDRTHAAR